MENPRNRNGANWNSQERRRAKIKSVRSGENVEMKKKLSKNESKKKKNEETGEEAMICHGYCVRNGQSVVCTSRDLRRVRSTRNRSNTYIYCRKLRCGMMSVDLIDYGTMVSTRIAHSYGCSHHRNIRAGKNFNNKFTSYSSTAATSRWTSFVWTYGAANTSTYNGRPIAIVAGINTIYSQVRKGCAMPSEYNWNVQ